MAIRKNVLQYDDVMNRQREIIYGQRDQVLNGEDLRDQIVKMIEQAIEAQVDRYLARCNPARRLGFRTACASIIWAG